MEQGAEGVEHRAESRGKREAVGKRGTEAIAQSAKLRNRKGRIAENGKKKTNFDH